MKMDISLDKIELVKDRTGASYQEAKDALEAAGGSVVDAIVAIEDAIGKKPAGNVSDQSRVIVEKIKELVKKGSVSKIIVKKNEEVLLNLPVNVGVVGTILAPWAMIFGLVVIFGTKCVVELVKEDGSIIDVSEMANETIDEMVDRGAAIADDLKNKGSGVYSNVVNKATDTVQGFNKQE
jgi:hypothetical protein